MVLRYCKMICSDKLSDNFASSPKLLNASGVLFSQSLSNTRFSRPLKIFKLLPWYQMAIFSNGLGVHNRPLSINHCSTLTVAASTPWMQTSHYHSKKKAFKALLPFKGGDSLCFPPSVFWFCSLLPNSVWSSKLSPFFSTILSCP